MLSSGIIKITTKDGMKVILLKTINKKFHFNWKSNIRERDYFFARLLDVIAGLDEVPECNKLTETGICSFGKEEKRRYSCIVCLKTRAKHITAAETISNLPPK